MSNEILANNIKTRTYNALSWACLFGDAQLALRCINLGADPDALFLHEDPQRPGGMAWGQQVGELDTMFCVPVFPTITRYKSVLPKEHKMMDMTSCALHVATRRNHIDVIKVLLGFPDGKLDELAPKAKLVERRTGRNPGDDLLKFFNYMTGHAAAVTHVRSAEAAKLLLELGEAQGDSHVNDCRGGGPRPQEANPLSVVLYGYNHRMGSAPTLLDPIPTGEVRDITLAFIDHGAVTGSDF